ncbi:MAG TPA: carboxypeptidase-like regulatory domain-containing protein [Pyrinomonadaceae bacterium]|nr:carboxypeptidase-like regulatory domain-containing protein [Pyrinomonadaceae bacterium]
MRARILIIALFSILAFANNASACSCAGNTAPCTAYKEKRAIFIGTVTSIDRASTEQSFYATLTVEQAFKGVNQTTVRMPQGTGGGDCSFVFEKGEKYLIYAAYSEDLKMFMTHICTRSRPLAYAGEDLAYLRGSPGTDSGTSLTGTVVNYDFYDEVNPSRPELIKGVKITAKGQNGAKFEAVTDDEGVYKIAGLPPGKYNVSAAIPSYLALAYEKPQTVEVPNNGCASLVVLTRTNGRISGVVRDAAGKLAPETDVDLIPFELAHRLGDRSIGRYEKTDYMGTFEFKNLRPGRYLIGVNIRSEPEGDNPYPRTFAPGVANVAQATIITLGKGEKLTGHDITLPPPLTVINITGVVVWPDGTPLQKGVVTLKDSSDIRGGKNLDFANVDEQGRFTLQALAGTEAWVHAGTTVRTDSGLDILTADPVRVVAASDLHPLKLTIAKKGPGGVRIIQ